MTLESGAPKSTVHGDAGDRTVAARAGGDIAFSAADRSPSKTAFDSALKAGGNTAGPALTNLQIVDNSTTPASTRGDVAVDFTGHFQMPVAGGSMTGDLGGHLVGPAANTEVGNLEQVLNGKGPRVPNGATGTFDQITTHKDGENQTHLHLHLTGPAAVGAMEGIGGDSKTNIEGKR